MYGWIKIGDQLAPIHSLVLRGGKIRIEATFSGPRPPTTGFIELLGDDRVLIRTGNTLQEWPEIESGQAYLLSYDLTVSDQDAGWLVAKSDG